MLTAWIRPFFSRKNSGNVLICQLTSEDVFYGINVIWMFFEILRTYVDMYEYANIWISRLPKGCTISKLEPSLSLLIFILKLSSLSVR